MNTYTGRVFNPLEMVPDNVAIEDIAHALSMMCRGNGHLRFFYSVGLHSINCAQEAIARGYQTGTVLACLLHDATEAYIADLIRPRKINCQSTKSWKTTCSKSLKRNSSCNI